MNIKSATTKKLPPGIESNQRRKRIAAAQKQYGVKALLPLGIAESNLDNQLGWAIQQLTALSRILKCPGTLAELVAHAEKVMALGEAK